MRFDVISLFPEMFSALRDHGVTARAHARQLWSLHLWNPRDYVHDVHRTVDDRPYGGGPGMVMLAEPLHQAVTAATQARGHDGAPVILMSPSGTVLKQDGIQELVQGQGATLVCGRYEGMDQRFIDRHVTYQISLGDFVLSGGEIAAMALMDAVIRLLPGALGHAQSAGQDSFHPNMLGLLDCQHYTRPETWQGQTVPDVLLSGDHARIAAWRREQSLRLTLQRRPDLIDAAQQRGDLSAAELDALGSQEDEGSGPR